jgi:hypothetical protein
MTGADLEQFVAALERSLLPPNFTVETRRREFGDNGLQVAEFDIVITGPLGSSTVSWLIECRDRPSEKSEPGAWIEQLDGRRRRFNFEKVTAVSTSGFAPGTMEYARKVGIELRTVRWLNADDFVDWFRVETFNVIHRSIHLEYAKLHVADTESPERQHAGFQRVRDVPLQELTLLNPKTGQLVAPVDAFAGAISRRPNLWPDNTTSDWSSDVEIDATYPADDCYILDTTAGQVPIPRILFRGILGIKMDVVPFVQFAEYRDELADCRVAACVSADYTVDEQGYRVTLERISVDGLENLRLRITKAP